MSELNQSEGDFHGNQTRIIDNGHIQLEYLAFSPRIVRMRMAGNDNLFADLGNEKIPTPYGDFSFRGGHRLWHSPESMPRTYVPDVTGVSITSVPGGVRFDQPAEQWTNIAKSMEIHFTEGKPQVIIQHELRNEGAWAVELSVWALTMFKLGGVAILPQPVGNTDPAGLLSNRFLTIWPYTNLLDPRLILRSDCILIKSDPKATPESSPVKLGYFNPQGWEAYWIDKVLFVKRFDVIPDVLYPDKGCNAESYCNHKFIELESLSPLVKLQPEETISHSETWELFSSLDQPFIPEGVREIIKGYNK